MIAAVRSLRHLARQVLNVRWHAMARLRRIEPDPDGVLAPGVEIWRDGFVFIDKHWSPAGVTAQFIGDAETYHQNYFNRLDFLQLIDRCLLLANIDRDRKMRVLDIGSGGGSSVFAACQLLPRAEIFASDISPQLLGLLASLAASRDELRGRIKVYCFDLHRRFFQPESFDIVIGAAILHHLLDPRAALMNVSRSLKPGGRIILIEPLEAGSLLLTSMYGRVLQVLGEVGQGDGELARLMKALRLDIQCRLGPPVEKSWTAKLDDKWVFDEPYLVDLAHQLKLSNVDVHPAQPDLSGVYEGAFRSVLADSGNGGLAVPEPVWQCVREFDRGIDGGLKKRLCPTGIIVFTK